MARAVPLRMLMSLLLLLSGGLLVQACNSDLSESLDGKLCGEAGECLAGYECDAATNRCVPVGSASSGGSSMGGSSGEPVVCREGETVCGGDCVVLSDDE